MVTPIIAGYKNNINVDKPLNKFLTPVGEFTILDEPVVAVIESKNPADEAAMKKAKIKNMAVYI